MSNIVAPFVATQALSFQQFCMCEFAHYNVSVYWWQSQKDENFCFLSTSSWWHYVVINGRIPSPELKVRREMMNNKAISTFSKKQINSQREWHVCTNIKLVCWWKSVRTSISKKRKKIPHKIEMKMKIWFLVVWSFNILKRQWTGFNVDLLLSTLLLRIVREVMAYVDLFRCRSI